MLDRRALFLLGAAALVACASGEPARKNLNQVAGSPGIEPVASIELAESDSSPMGNYLFPSKRPDGGLYVADMSNSHVLQFDARGNLIRTIGRKGQGPGEFEGPGMNGLVENGRTLAVFDVSSGRMHLMRTDSGSFMRSFMVPGNNIGMNWTLAGDTVLFAMTLSPGLLVRWVLDGDSITTLGKTPQRLLDEPMTVLQHGRAEVARSDRGMVALLQTEPGLQLLDAEGKETGFITIPSRRRRGEPSDLVAKAKAEQAKGMAGLAPVGSAVVGLRRLSNGMLATLMLDVDQIANPTENRPGTQLFGNFRIWASLVKPDLSAACVDAPVPVTSDVVPLPFFSGDTLWVLSRQTGAGDSVQTKVNGFLLDDGGCDWIESGGIAAARP